MQNLASQEQFEIEVLDKLNSARLLRFLVFEGGTMMRLCYGLNRFSVDLDFSFMKKIEPGKFFKQCKQSLKQNYEIRDAINKFYTILFELSSSKYPRNLKIEVRKEVKRVQIEETIAYSKHSTKQVLVNTVSLSSMMDLKIKAFLERGEIRDCFDIEFLLKRDINLNAPNEILEKVLAKIKHLNKKDYTVKLGSLLEKEKERRYYTENNFKLLQLEIMKRLG